MNTGIQVDYRDELLAIKGNTQKGRSIRLFRMHFIFAEPVVVVMRNARDLWEHEDVRFSGDFFSATIPPHGVLLLKVSAR